MTRFEFLQTLKAAMHGLPAETIERTVADYERRFEQGMATGRSEADVAQELGDPWGIAARLRLPARDRVTNGAAKAGRVFISGLGLAVFNLFMIVPTIIYGVLLMALCIAAVACYLGGIVMTASSLSGIEEVAFRLPFEQVVMEANGPRRTVGDHAAVVAIGDYGIQIAHGDDIVPTPGAAASASSAPAASAPVISVGGPNMITPDDTGDSRALRTARSVGIVLGGIFLLLLCGVLIKYTWIGMKRYVQMNISTLRNA